MTTSIYTHTKSLEKRKDTWLNKAKLKHNSKYKYPFMEDYINAHSVMRIICPIHGEFKITAHNILAMVVVGGVAQQRRLQNNGLNMLYQYMDINLIIH